MALHASDRVTYYLALAAEHSDYLGALRDADNLAMATDAGTIWVKGLTQAQAAGAVVRSIPFARLYEAAGGRLFVPGHLLPEAAEPALLWTPIARALPLRLPAASASTAVAASKLLPGLVADEVEREPAALLLPLNVLGQYIGTAAAVRLQPLSWALTGQEALLLGTPLLPLPGAVYWRLQNLLLPAGFQLRRPMLAGMLQQALDPAGKSFIIAGVDGSWQLLEHTMLRPLDRASFRLSVNENHG